MEALAGKLDEKSITESIETREKLSELTNKVAGFEAELNTLGLKEKIAEEKDKIETNKLLADKHDLEYRHKQFLKIVPEKVSVELAQQKSEILVALNESDTKL